MTILLLLKRVFVFAAICASCCASSCMAQDHEMSPQEIQSATLSELRGRDEGRERIGAPMPVAGPVGVLSVGPPIEVGVTSIARLLHKVPSRAQKAYQRATKLSQSGKHLEAARELKQALAYDPDFAEAHNNLGVQYVDLGRFADAKDELRRAIELDPAFGAAHMNLAWVELQIGDLPAAEAHIRRAMALVGRNDQVRLLLESVLARTTH